MDDSTKIYPVSGPTSQEKSQVWYDIIVNAQTTQQYYSPPKMKITSSVYPNDYVSFNLGI